MFLPFGSGDNWILPLIDIRMFYLYIKYIETEIIMLRMSPD